MKKSFNFDIKKKPPKANRKQGQIILNFILISIKLSK